MAQKAFSSSGNAKRSEPCVFAHFMLGNTYSYTRELWVQQMQLASSAGLDGFALNLGREDWQMEQSLTAAELCPSQFSLFLSLDMDILPSATQQDAESLIAKVVAFATHHDGRHRMVSGDGRTMLSTFSGGSASFGGLGWSGILGILQERGFPIYFCPSFFLPPETLIADPLIDAVFSWNHAWPEDQGPIDTTRDEPFRQACKPMMAAVSPCFFTHYGTKPPWGWNKNWIYASDENLYANRWNQIINMRPEFVQIISWNDGGESHYIGPLAGSQPGCDAWAQDHTALLYLTRHFVARFKGVPWESESERDYVYLSYRTAPARVEAQEDPVGRPQHIHRARDLISIYSTLGQPYTLEISASPAASSIALPQGSFALTVPFEPGRVIVTVRRGGSQGCVVASVEGVPIATPEETRVYNFNPTTLLIHVPR